MGLAAVAPAMQSARVRAAWAALAQVLDPEVPALSVCDLGIVREVVEHGDGLEVVLTPTYSGCPAMKVIEDDIRAALVAVGAPEVTVRTVYAPAWTTDWIGAEAKEKLRRFGIAPPGPAPATELVTLERRQAPVACPYCGSPNTRLQSEFGSTACKAIHVCEDCRQPFDEFKAI